MDPDGHLDAVRAASAALLFAVESGGVDDPVPTCEGWEIRDLAVHVGGICRFVAGVLAKASGRPDPDPDEAEAPEGDAVATWLLDACVAVTDGLAAVAPSAPTWTWYPPDQTAGFFRRRLAHELTIHRFDAEWTRGIPSPVPAELAADGVDEFVDFLASGIRPLAQPGSGRRLGLRASDAGLQWVVTLGPDRVEVARGDGDPGGDPDLMVTGTTSDLELTLYGRPTLSPVDVHGDYTVLDEWRRDYRL